MNLLKRILVSTKVVYHLRKKNMFHELISESSSELRNSEKGTNPGNLIYKYKTEKKNSWRFYKFSKSSRPI